MDSSDNTSREQQRQRNPSRRTRRWLPYAGISSLAAIIIAGLWPRAVPVEIGRVTVGALRTTVNEEGKTRIRQRFVVSAPATGQLRRIPFKPGAKVESGMTVVAVIDPVSPVLLDARTRSLAEARRDTAAANVEKAHAAHAFASSEFRRIEKLYAENTVSSQEFETAQWREATSDNDVAATTSALREAEAELTEFFDVTNGGTNSVRRPIEVKTPASGHILHVFEESSRAVTVGTPLLEIGDRTDLEVVIEVLSRDGAAITPGTKVELDQWGGDEPLGARVRIVEPAAFTKISALGVEEQRVNVIADLDAPPEQRSGLGDNFRVEARIVTWETDQTIKVPTGAMFRRGEEWAVFVVSNGRAELRTIEAGRSNGVETQVINGLKEGTEVILYPGDRVQHGQRLKSLQISTL